MTSAKQDERVAQLRTAADDLQVIVPDGTALAILIRRAASELELLGITADQRKQDAEYWKRRYDQLLVKARAQGYDDDA